MNSSPSTPNNTNREAPKSMKRNLNQQVQLDDTMVQVEDPLAIVTTNTEDTTPATSANLSVATIEDMSKVLLRVEKDVHDMASVLSTHVQSVKTWQTEATKKFDSMDEKLEKLDSMDEKLEKIVAALNID